MFIKLGSIEMNEIFTQEIVGFIKVQKIKQ